ncbi:putative L-ascorbate peroxidase 3 [Hibiscus syriacus]|uniref:L-ascorbate peroxidase n=1 Tax=Hibiscus syriacus TaxID=106335 RepID=A0A6A2YG42_HIBSY|nr:putative L-ascorbate peroxidase 3 [Hibiscus syriacus]
MAFPVVDTEYVKEIDKARRVLRALITLKNCAPIMLRLAWYDAGTYDVSTKTGGPNGSIRNEEEYTHGANNGLKIALDFCEGVKAKHPKITYADLYQLAGVVAVEVTGGPTIDFVPERKDSNICPKEGQLPDAKRGAPHLRDIFYRMSLSDKDIVALSGGHTLGRAHPERSGFDGPWTNEPLKFDNSYFVELLKEESEGLLKLPTDKALLDDSEFRKYVELYSKVNTITQFVVFVWFLQTFILSRLFCCFYRPYLHHTCSCRSVGILLRAYPANLFEQLTIVLV